MICFLLVDKDGSYFIDIYMFINENIYSKTQI